MAEVMFLYRPIGPKELELIQAWGWKAFPARLPEQPIFYPVVNQEYASWISRHWNVRDYGVGYVTRFAVDAEFVSRYPARKVGMGDALELWVPAEDLDEFNLHIMGPIEVVEEYPPRTF